MQPVWMRASFAAAVLKVFGGKPFDSRIAIGAGVLFTAESLTHSLRAWSTGRVVRFVRSSSRMYAIHMIVSAVLG
jgi:hypothetical protein